MYRPLHRCLIRTNVVGVLLILYIYLYYCTYFVRIQYCCTPFDSPVCLCGCCPLIYVLDASVHFLGNIILCGHITAVRGHTTDRRQKTSQHAQQFFFFLLLHLFFSSFCGAFPRRIFESICREMIFCSISWVIYNIYMIQ